VRRIVPSTPPSSGAGASSSLQRAGPTTSQSATLSGGKNEVLIIASRFKEFIAEQSGFNTSGGVMDVLSNHLRIVAARAIENAQADGRKTVMERDFEFLKGR